MEFGQKVKSKATGAVGELIGIKGDKLIVTFENSSGIEVSPEFLDIDEELKQEIEKELSSSKTKKDNKKQSYSSVKLGPLISKTPNMIYFNIAYMKYYKDITDDDKPYNGGKYINDTGDAGEKFNFEPYDDEYVYGYVETGFSKGGYKEGDHKLLHIENIDPSAKGENHISNTIVVMCANSPIENKTVIVGWYDNATVYRGIKKLLYKDVLRWVNCKCKIEDAHLIDENDRYFKIPRAAQEGQGFGQSNFWYANKETDYDFRIKTLEYLDKMREKY